MQTMSDELLQPLRAYKNVLKKRQEVYTRDLFEELVKKSGIDVSENHRTVQAYNEEQEKIKNIAKKLSKLRTLRTRKRNRRPESGALCTSLPPGGFLQRAFPSSPLRRQEFLLQTYRSCK